MCYSDDFEVHVKFSYNECYVNILSKCFHTGVTCERIVLDAQIHIQLRHLTKDLSKLDGTRFHK